MLQFWLPRTAQFEEAVLGSLRWPFLFQDFDPAAERATIRILETLSRFENVGELPREVLTSILVNQALRQKLAVEGDVRKQVELVREALVEENEKVRSALASTTEEAKRLKLEVAEKDEKVMALTGLLEEGRRRSPKLKRIGRASGWRVSNLALGSPALSSKFVKSRKGGRRINKSGGFWSGRWR
jgi:hypothetical protein